MISLIDGRSKKQHLSSSDDERTNSMTLTGNRENTSQNKIQLEPGISAPELNADDSSRKNSALISGRSAQRKEKARKRKSKKGGRKNRKRNNANQDVEPDDILRETMIHMFGFKHMPTKQNCAGLDCSRRSGGGQSIPKGVDIALDGNPSSAEAGFKPNPPSFMLELYRSYTEDKDLMMLHSKSQGNTVRSFYPSPANPQHREKNFGQAIVISPAPRTEAEFTPTSVFLFNITVIPTLEDLVAAEIRLDGHLTGSNEEVIVGVYKQHTECEDDLECERNAKVFSKVGKTLFLNSLSETTWSDSKLAKLAKRARQEGHVVIVKFASEPHDVDDVPSRLRRHLFDLPSSFVSGEVSRSKRSNRENGSPDDLEAGEDNQFLTSVIPMFIAYCNDPRTTSEAESLPAAPVIWKALENITSSIRVRRSAVPDSDPLPSHSDTNSNMEDGASKEKRQRDAPMGNTIYVVDKRKPGNKRRRKNKHNLQVSRNATHAGHDSGQARSSKRNRNRGRGNRRLGRKNKIHKNDRIDIKLHSSLNSERQTEPCGRRSLLVSFADIGWSEWIISPENFEAYYCSGTCDLARVQDSSTTNHAIIQAVVKNIAGHSHLPSPCCVPDKLMPLSVLFFDEDKNVVLKVFPNMSVETCACR